MAALTIPKFVQLKQEKKQRRVLSEYKERHLHGGDRDIDLDLKQRLPSLWFYNFGVLGRLLSCGW